VRSLAGRAARSVTDRRGIGLGEREIGLALPAMSTSRIGSTDPRDVDHAERSETNPHHEASASHSRSTFSVLPCCSIRGKPSSIALHW
jgi:hypothetical protein